MEGALGFLVLVVVFGIVVALYQSSKRAWLEFLHEVGGTYGLRVEPGTFWKNARAVGEPHGIPLVLDTYTVSRGKSSTTYTRVTARPAHLPRDFSLKPEGIGSMLGKLFRGQDVVLGDATFDQAATLRADELTARAVLSEENRRLALACLSDDIVVEDGEVRWVTSGLVRDSVRVGERIRQVLALAQALDARDVRTRLLKVGLEDPEQAVADGALRMLVERWRLSEAEVEALLTHRRAEVRLLGAQAAGAWEPALALLDDGRQGAELRASAFAILLRIDRARAVQAARERVGRRLPVLLGTALLEALAAAQTGTDPAELQPWLDESDGALRVALASVLGFSDPPSVAMLLELLKDPDERVATAAARSLGRQGTVEQVAALRERAKGFLVGGALKQAVDEAVAALQSEVGPLGGGLSLLRDRAQQGALSEQATPGGLSEREG